MVFMNMREPVCQCENWRRDLMPILPHSHMPDCQDKRGGICLMYSIYSQHTRCCTTASSVAWDTPLTRQVAINQTEWRGSAEAKTYPKSTSAIVDIEPMHPRSRTQAFR